jgi:hypothetical protein
MLFADSSGSYINIKNRPDIDLARKQDSQIKENISITLPAARSRRNPAKTAIAI